LWFYLLNPASFLSAGLVGGWWCYLFIHSSKVGIGAPFFVLSLPFSSGAKVQNISNSCSFVPRIFVCQLLTGEAVRLAWKRACRRLAAFDTWFVIIFFLCFVYDYKLLYAVTDVKH
jgi:hypothetical protein